VETAKIKQTEDRYGGIGDAAVKAKTGKVWREWFAILDARGAAKWPHPDIARYLSDKQGVPDWWCQMVTVGYEQARGLRQKHETSEGYQVSASKTFQMPLSALYKAWADGKSRAKLIPGHAITVRTANTDKNIRALWSDGASTIEVYFYDKGAGKCQVVVQHSKLPDAAKADEMKAYWKDALERLKQTL